MANEVSKQPVTHQQLVSVKIGNYLASENINRMISSVLKDRAGSFIATLTSLVNNNSKLMACDKSTVLTAALKAAGLNLPIEPSLGFAYIIPYGDQAQFQLSYKGLTQLALRSGVYAGINAMEVRDGEFFGRDDLGDPIIHWFDEGIRMKKKVIGYMAGFKTVRGMTKKVYWTTEQVEKHADRFSQGFRSFKAKGKSQSTARSGNMENPWSTDFDSMSCKTVLKSLLSKYGELSVEMQQAIKYDQSVVYLDESGNEMEPVYPDNTKDVVQEGLTKAQQEEILSTYDAATVKEALYNVGFKDITDISPDSLESFKSVCEDIKAENAKVSGDVSAEKAEGKQLTM